MLRETSAEAESLSGYLRNAADDTINARRRVTSFYLAGTAALVVVAAYQMGVIKRVPEPRLSFLDADRVDASGEAYESLRMPDAVLGIVSYSISLALVTSGGRRRNTTHPWLPVAATIKVAFDAALGVMLTVEQVAKHRALCSWCVIAAAASWISLPSTLPEARLGLRNLLGRGRS